MMSGSTKAKLLMYGFTFIWLATLVIAVILLGSTIKSLVVIFVAMLVSYLYGAWYIWSQEENK